MTQAFRKHVQNLRFLLAAMLTLLCAGCSLHGGAPRATFHFGPVHADMSDLPLAPQTAPSSESRAARLREDLLAPVNRYAPSDKDWRMVRGTDKGPNIIGVGLRFHLQDDEWQMRLGWQRRGSTRMFGPEFTMSFDGR